MTSKQVNLEFLLKKTIADLVKDEITENRKDVFEVLLEQYDNTGSKQFVVKLPNGDKVATFTVAEPKPRERIDDEKLIDWLIENGYGDQVITKTVPAREERAVKTGALGAIGAELTDDGYYVTPAGEIVEGIEQVPAERPKSFTVRYADKLAPARIIRAWRGGELSEVDAGEVLPQLSAAADGDVVEGEVVEDTPEDKE